MKYEWDGVGKDPFFFTFGGMNLKIVLMIGMKNGNQVKKVKIVTKKCMMKKGGGQQHII